MTFLRHLFKVEHAALPSYTPSHKIAEQSASETKLLAKLHVDPEYVSPKLTTSRYNTGVSVSFIEETWDSLPSKATRPMASTNLGTLLVVAVRLGMKWRINLEKDTYEAVGNGYSLSCTQVPEMGLVALFTADETEEHNFDRRLAFNRPTDMLMCGIIPGSSLLVNATFYCTDDLGATDVLKSVLDVIDIHNRLHRKLRLDRTPDESDVRERNVLTGTVMALLCELPFRIEDDQTANIYDFPCGLSSSPLTSDGWLSALSRDDGSIQLHKVFNHSKELRYENPVLDRQSQISQFCRYLYDRTTIWFLSNGFDEQRYGLTKYMHLVVAHCLLVHEAWGALQANRVDWVDESDPDNEIFMLGEKCIDMLFGFKYAASSWVEYHNAFLHSLRIEEAWVVMMLRGTAWSMLTTRRKGSGSGQAIPSSCWDSPRPVWMI